MTGRRQSPHKHISFAIEAITVLYAMMGMSLRGVMVLALLLPTACSAPRLPQTRPVLPLIDRALQRVERQKAFVYLEQPAFNPRPFGLVQQTSLPTARDGLRQLMHACFQGSIEALLATVSSKTGYRWRLEGSRPAAPILVSINRDRASAYAILEEGLLQAQGLVKLRIDNPGRWMTLRYNRRDRSLLAHLDEAGF